MTCRQTNEFRSLKRKVAGYSHLDAILWLEAIISSREPGGLVVLVQHYVDHSMPQMLAISKAMAVNGLQSDSVMYEASSSLTLPAQRAPSLQHFPEFSVNILHRQHQVPSGNFLNLNCSSANNVSGFAFIFAGDSSATQLCSSLVWWSNDETVSQMQGRESLA